MDTTIVCPTILAKAGSSDMSHKTSLTKGIRVGPVIKVCSFVSNNAWGDGQDAKAALHFNPHMELSTVVFNTLELGPWGPEEHGSGISFQHR